MSSHPPRRPWTAHWACKTTRNHTTHAITMRDERDCRYNVKADVLKAIMVADLRAPDFYGVEQPLNISALGRSEPSTPQRGYQWTVAFGATLTNYDIPPLQVTPAAASAAAAAAAAAAAHCGHSRSVAHSRFPARLLSFSS